MLKKDDWGYIALSFIREGIKETKILLNVHWLYVSTISKCFENGDSGKRISQMYRYFFD